MAQLTELQPPPRLRSRPIGVGQLRVFAAVARHLNFHAAAEEPALTQSAGSRQPAAGSRQTSDVRRQTSDVSRQIQAIEGDVGVALFRRHTRAVELTGAGASLLRAVQPSIERIDSAVRQIRHSAERKSVAITTWASFASVWLIPRFEAFQCEHPDIDVRIDASDAMVDLDTADIDLALRYAAPGAMPAKAVRLFGEQLAVASPWLLKTGARLDQPPDLAALALIEASDDYSLLHMDWLSWQRWIGKHHPKRFEPRRWLYFNCANQMAQAELTGQGVATAALPLVADGLASGDLVELLPTTRLNTPLAYWLMVGQQSRDRSEVIAFCGWLRKQAQITRATIGEAPDPAFADDLDQAEPSW